MLEKDKKERDSKIIDLYNSGLSMQKVADVFNISSTTVLNVLNKYKIPKRTKGGIYKLPEQEIIAKYLEGNSCQVIAENYKVTFHTISNILEKNNIKRDNRYNNLNLDIHYFQDIDRYDKAYFLGFMITDGNVSLKDNTIALVLSAKDEKILEIFKQKTGNENELYIRKDEKHNEKGFKLKNSDWKKDLAKYGVVPQKTNTVGMPLLSQNLMPHLIRGMIDGDGWISYLGKSLGFCGNNKIVTQLHDYLVQELNVYNVKIIQTQPNLWQITWSAKKDIEKIGNFIYKDKNDCYLERKYDNFLKIVHGNTEVNS